TQFGTKTADGDRIQKLAYGATSWTTTGTTLFTKHTYPRVSLLPDGRLFVASPANGDRKNYIYDPEADSVSPAGTDVVPESEPGQVHCCESWKGTGVMLPLVP